MNLEIILTAIFVPVFVTLFLSVVQKSGNNVNKRMTNENFVVFIPKIVLSIGICCTFMSIIVIICFTIFSEELPNIIFYIVFGMFLWLGLYLILKTAKWRVIVKKDTITVCPILTKPYSFNIDEIISAKRQIKQNQTKSERIIIKTQQNKKFIVESSEVSYQRFLQKLKEKVNAECLIGFELLEK